MSREPSGAEKMFGDFAPKLVQLTDQVLFGDVWDGEGGSPEVGRRRSPSAGGALRRE